MKAIYFNEYGGTDSLIYGQRPDPVAGDGEVLVRIRAAGVNPVDWKIREGRLKDRMPNLFPIIPGWDLAGTVEAVGLGVRRFTPGDKVYALARRSVIQNGTYAELTVVPECYLSLKPGSIGFDKAAAVPLAALTAYQGLFDKASLVKGETCVIVGASGGVGSFAVQFARRAGAKVVAVASARHQAYLRDLGANKTIDYAAGDCQQQVRGVFAKGVDVVFDMRGGDTLRHSYRMARRGGRVVTITEPGDQQEAKRLGIKLLYHFVTPDAPRLELFARLIDQKRLAVHIAQRFPLEQAALAQTLIATGHTRGKIVLVV